MTSKKTLGIYVHIPFCQRKCPYCDFYSLVAGEDLHKEYTQAVIEALSQYENSDLKVNSVYFGGGTPSVINPTLIGKIMQKLSPMLLEDCEISMEMNPCSVSEENLKIIKQSGINRISFGMQSASDDERTVLGRKHDNAQVKRAVNLAKSLGFDNISVDVMLGVPHQTLNSIDVTLDFVRELDIQHVSAYMLKVEENTPFNSPEMIDLIANDDEVSDIYLKVCTRLQEMGFEQYEISNFSKKGRESRHNLKYWQRKPYIGIGPAAHSFYENKRFFYPRNIEEFINSRGTNQIIDEDVGEIDSLDEYIMLGLRLSEGINLEFLQSEYGVTSGKDFLKKADKYISYGLMQRRGDVISLTSRGFLLSNAIILDFLE